MYNQQCFAYNVQVGNFRVQTTRKMHKYAALTKLCMLLKLYTMH
jgi:hypothetical protein